MCMIFKRVEDLKPGDRLDLENDEYADPNGKGYYHNFYECELIEVEDIDVYLDSVVVYTSNGPCNFKFPCSHRVQVITSILDEKAAKEGQ